MKKLRMIKASKNSKMWRKNQKLWNPHPTGSQAAQVVGKYRGNGRYVKAWYHWNDSCLPDFIECDVSDEFYNKIKEKYDH